MSTQQEIQTTEASQAVPVDRNERIVRWLEDPMNSCIVASLATISTLGIVLSSMWFIQLVLG